MNKLSDCRVTIDGKVIESPKLLSKFGKVHIFRTTISVKRWSGKADTFLLDYSSELGVVLKEGDFIHVTGDIRTLNIKNSTKSVENYILAETVTKLDTEPENYENACEIDNCSFVELISSRKSYSDENTNISDYTIGVNRKHGRVSYFRATSWGSDAIFIGNTYKHFKKANIKCRLQSYDGKLGDKHYICLAVYHFGVINEADEVKETSEADSGVVGTQAEAPVTDVETPVTNVEETITNDSVGQA